MSVNMVGAFKKVFLGRVLFCTLSIGFIGCAMANEASVGTSECNARASVVQNCPGYNSWPMVQAIGTRLVCAYSRGWGHNIFEEGRGVYAMEPGHFAEVPKSLQEEIVKLRAKA